MFYVYSLLITIGLLLFSIKLEGQSISNLDNKILLNNERSFYGLLHNQGLGLGFRRGSNITALHKKMFEISFYNIKHPKEIKMINSMLFMDAKSYVYGKMNYFYILETGVGGLKIINEKPYWGGVELRYFYSLGFSLGLTKPVYLYVYEFNDYTMTTRLEKYNPEKHFYDNIYGRGPFLKGFNEIKFHPGGHFKFGFNFEHASEDEVIRSLETGIMIDVFLKEIQIMSFTKNYKIFSNFYLQYHFGKRW